MVWVRNAFHIELKLIDLEVGPILFHEFTFMTWDPSCQLNLVLAFRLIQNNCLGFFSPLLPVGNFSIFENPNQGHNVALQANIPGKWVAFKEKWCCFSNVWHFKNARAELKPSTIFSGLYCISKAAQCYTNAIHLGLFSSCYFPLGKIFRNRAQFGDWNYKEAIDLDAFPALFLMILLILFGDFTPLFSIPLIFPSSKRLCWACSRFQICFVAFIAQKLIRALHVIFFKGGEVKRNMQKKEVLWTFRKQLNGR